jgi:hypothetical protein
MNLTRKQITIVVASLFAHQNEYRPDSEMYKNIDEFVKLFDLEHHLTLTDEEYESMFPVEDEE